MQTLVSCLCASQNTSSEGASSSGCAVSMRAIGDGHCVQEFFDVCGSERFEPGRSIFYRAAPFDGIMFVHDLSDPCTRSALSRIWVPATMAIYGDIKAVESGERHKAAGFHVSSRGVLSELKLLWLRATSKHSGTYLRDAILETARLLLRYFRLICNEYDIWRNDDIDQSLEKELLSTSSIPVAIVGLKQDLTEYSARLNDLDGLPAKSAAVINLNAVEANNSPGIASFLRRAAEHARRNSTAVLKSPVSSAGTYISLPL